MRFKLIVGALLVVALVVTGCGGSDSSSSGSSAANPSSTGSTDGTNPTNASSNDGTTGGKEGEDGKSGKPLTKKEFIAEGESICQNIPVVYGELVAELEKEKGKKPPTAETNLKAAVPPIFSAVEEFENLTPPQGEEKQAEEIIDSLEAAGKGLEEEPTAPLSGPKSPYNEFQEVTKKIGLNFCSNL
jgi:hypothetical protein